MGISNEAKNVIPVKFLRKFKNNFIFLAEKRNSKVEVDGRSI
jgi:hypothetical protein